MKKNAKFKKKLARPARKNHNSPLSLMVPGLNMKYFLCLRTRGIGGLGVICSPPLTSHISTTPSRRVKPTF